MNKFSILFTIIVFTVFSNYLNAKSLGNLKSYYQVTDKEILFETTNGAQVLVTAYDNFAMGITVVNQGTNLQVSTPNQVLNRKDLAGSIYVEEIDELMQVNTTAENGVYLQVQKKPLQFNVISKINSEVLIEDFSKILFNKKNTNIEFQTSKEEEIKILSNTNLETQSTDLKLGQVYDSERIDEILYPNNEICLVSSKGYSVIFDSNIKHEINYTKPDKISVSIEKKQTPINYILIYGDQQTELIDKFAFHMTNEDKQISFTDKEMEIEE